MIDYIKRHRNVRHVIDYEKELIEQFETISFDDNNNNEGNNDDNNNDHNDDNIDPFF